MSKLIILPGAGGDGSFFSAPIAKLKQAFDPQILVLDDQENRHEMAEFVLKNAPEKFFLLGHSMGGWVAQEVAAEAPERVEKLILLSSWTGVKEENKRLLELAIPAIKAGHLNDVVLAQRPKMIYPPKLEDPKFLELLKYCQFRQPEEVYVRQLTAILKDYSTKSLLDKILSPTMIIHGRQDELFPLSEQEALRDGIKDAKLEIIEECGHLAPIEQPQKLISLIASFLHPSA
ncbi:MAG: alpha/beta hydrolase [Candidatus Algichlamydia australiensis]|nr:alpha/beta hydrolase [Chlamydiales bacterium]